jgi:hypothetical protein
MNAIETTGIDDDGHQSRVDEPLPISGKAVFASLCRFLFMT